MSFIITVKLCYTQKYNWGLPWNYQRCQNVKIVDSIFQENSPIKMTNCLNNSFLSLPQISY